MKEQDDNKLISIVKLGMWLVFIILLTIVAKFSNKVNGANSNFDDNKQEVEIIKYEEKLSKLTNNYKYNYEIKFDNEIYRFVGSKLNNKESGYRFYNNEYLYYFLENGFTYSVNNGGLDKIESIYNDIDTSIFDIENIKDSILTKVYDEDNNKYTYILSDRTILVYTDSLNVTKIEVYIGENYYKLEFNDIGLVKEIKY